MIGSGNAAIAAALGACLLAGCASSPRKIEAAYASPMKFQHLSCEQAALERTAVQYRAQMLYSSLKKRATRDAAAMGVGAVLFLPTLLLIRGNGAKAAEYAGLKGDYNALRMSAEDRGCGLEFADLDQVAADKQVTAELVAEGVQPVSAKP